MDSLVAETESSVTTSSVMTGVISVNWMARMTCTLMTCCLSSTVSTKHFYIIIKCLCIGESKKNCNVLVLINLPGWRALYFLYAAVLFVIVIIVRALIAVTAITIGVVAALMTFSISSKSIFILLIP